MDTSPSDCERVYTQCQRTTPAAFLGTGADVCSPWYPWNAVKTSQQGHLDNCPLRWESGNGAAMRMFTLASTRAFLRNRYSQCMALRVWYSTPQKKGCSPCSKGPTWFAVCPRVHDDKLWPQLADAPPFENGHEPSQVFKVECVARPTDLWVIFCTLHGAVQPLIASWGVADEVSHIVGVWNWGLEARQRQKKQVWDSRKYRADYWLLSQLLLQSRGHAEVNSLL